MAERQYFRGDRLRRLRESLRTSRRKLGYAREEQRQLVKQMVGTHYSENGAEHPVPMNMIELFISVYSRLLGGSAPSVMFSTRNQPLRSKVAQFEVVFNDLLSRHLRFLRTQQRWIRNALISVGILAHGIAPDEDEVYETEDGEEVPMGSVYCKDVSLDDWVHEWRARDLEEAAFMGYRFRAPLEEIKESSTYRNTEHLSATHRSDGESGGETRLEDIGHGEDGVDDDDYREYFEGWRLWFPDEQMMTVLPVQGGDPIWEVEYEGPPPFTTLSFGSVPDQALPLAPAQLLLDLHDFINSTFRKIMSDTKNAKTILAYLGAAQQDAERVTESGNLKAVRVDNLKGLQEINLNGPNGDQVAVFLQALDKFDMLGSNLSALAGLGPQADTLGQEELISKAASSRVLAMRDEVYGRMEEVMRALAWWFWTDPVADHVATFDVEPLGEFPVQLSAMDRDPEDWDFFQMSIEPYSMQRHAPEQKAQKIMGFLERVVFPLLPMMQQQGAYIRAESLFRTLAKYMNMPEIDDLLAFGDPELLMQGGQEYPNTGQSPVTHRINERVNRPGGNRRSIDGNLAQALMGKGIQDGQAEAAATGRK